MFQLRSKNDETKSVIKSPKIIKKRQKRDRLEHLHEKKKKDLQRILLKVKIRFIMASFDGKVWMCVENIVEFLDLVKRDHDISNYPFNKCEVGNFSNELYNYVHSERRSVRLVEKKIFSLYEKYSQGFSRCFEIGRNRNYYLHYFSKKNKEKKGTL